MQEDFTNETTAKDSDALRKVHTLAIKRHDTASSVGRDQADRAIEDTRFSQEEGAQWDDLSKKRRRNRPRLEFNKIQLAVNKVVGDQMQNRNSPKVRPAGGEANKKTAETLNGIIRNIESQSNFSNVRNGAFKEVVTGGVAAWKITTHIPGDDTFDQEIRIEAIPSAVTKVFWDPSAIDPNKRDAKYCFNDSWISTEDFEELWPDKTADSISESRSGFFRRISNWFRAERVRISDYWVKEPVTKKLVQMTNGKVYEMNEDFEKVRDELAEQTPPVTIAITPQGNEMIQERKSHKVVHYKISGGDVLSGPNEWAGKHIPIVPIFGYQMHIGEDHHYRGITRFAKDPQRMLNFSMSSNMETIAKSPQDPYWMTPEQIKGHEQQVMAMNVSNKPVMLYNADPSSPGAPRRTGAPSVNSAMINQIQMADKYIQDTTGLFDVSLGDNPRNQSGKAILAQQAQGDSATFELLENAAMGIQYTTEIVGDLIPKIYDNKRQIRIVQGDGETEMVMINETVFDEESGEDIILNDLAQGKYDFVADVAPSFKTQRTEAVNALTELGINNPAFAQLSADLIAKNLAFSESEELTKRLRKVGAAQGFIDLTEDEIKEQAEKDAAQAPQQQEPSPAEQMQMQQFKGQLEEQALKNDELEARGRKLQLENLKLQQEIELAEKTPLEEAAEEEQIVFDAEKTEAEIEKIKSETLKNEHEIRKSEIELSSGGDSQNQ